MIKSILNPIIGIFVALFGLFTPSPDIDMQNITLQAEYDNPTSEEMNSAVALIRTRLDSIGCTEARLEISDNNQLEIFYPSETDREKLIYVITSPAELRLVDADGNLLLDNSHITSATARFDSLGADGSNVHYVELNFTEEGRKLFAEATERISQLPSGENSIAITVDGQIISCPSVMAKIESPTVVISGDFTADTATHLAAILNSGCLPFSFSIVE